MNGKLPCSTVHSLLLFKQVRGRTISRWVIWIWPYSSPRFMNRYQGVNNSFRYNIIWNAKRFISLVKLRPILVLIVSFRWNLVEKKRLIGQLCLFVHIAFHHDQWPIFWLRIPDTAMCGINILTSNWTNFNRFSIFRLDLSKEGKLLFSDLKMFLWQDFWFYSRYLRWCIGSITKDKMF